MTGIGGQGAVVAFARFVDGALRSCEMDGVVRAKTALTRMVIGRKALGIIVCPLFFFFTIVKSPRSQRRIARS